MDALAFTTSGQSGWSNVLFCSLLHFSTQIIPFLGFIVMQGYFAEVHRRLVLQRPEPYLRFDFSDLSPYLSRGVVPFVVSLLVALPFGIVLGVLAIAVFIAAGLAAGAGTDEGLAMLVAFAGAGLVSIPLMAFWLVLTNAAVTRAELMGQVGKALDLGAIWSYGARTWKRAVLTGIVLWLLWFGLFIAGMLACFIGIFVTMTIGLIAQLHVRWQIYNEYLRNGGEPIELAPFEQLPSEAPRQPPPGPPPPGTWGTPPGYAGSPPGYAPP